MQRPSTAPPWTRGDSGPLVLARQPWISILALALVAFTTPLARGAGVSVKEIVEHLDARALAFQNVHTIATWDYLKQSKTPGGTVLVPQSWDKQEIYSDGFQRIRRTSRAGTFSPEGAKVSSPSTENYYLFDGEKTVFSEYFPGSDRDGVPVVAEKRATSRVKMGYRTAQVHDGPFPQPNGPWRYNNPMTFMDGVKRAIVSALAEGRDPKVAEDPTRRGLYLVTYRLDPDADPFHLVYTATVDANLGWAITEFQAKDAEGRRLIECGNEYRTLDGLVVPTRGFWRNWSVDQLKIPLTEKRYEVSTIVVNDPGFSEDVFKVVLEPDTAVSDIRYHVDYRVGAEREIDANLALLAQAAQKARDAEDNSRSRTGGASPISRVVLIWTTVTLIGICIAVLVVVFRPRSSAQTKLEDV